MRAAHRTSAQYEALVLRVVPYGEADLVIDLFCRGRGRVSTFARAARKSAKRFGGGIEPFTLMTVELQDRSGSDLLELKSTTILNPHLELRTELGRLAHAGYATELCRELLQDNAPHDALFSLLLSYLALLTRAGARSLCLRAFELGAVGAAGFSPQLEVCAGCGTGPQGRQLAFDAALGGVACAQCAGSQAFGIDLATVRTLQALQEGGLEASAQAQDEGLPVESLRRVMSVFIRCHVGRDLKSLAFMRDVGAPL